MLKSLRRKFVAIIMALVALVLVASFSGIVYAQYRNETDSMRAALESAAMRGAEPETFAPGEMGPDPAGRATDKDSEIWDDDADESPDDVDDDSDFDDDDGVSEDDFEDESEDGTVPGAFDGEGALDIADELDDLEFRPHIGAGYAREDLIPVAVYCIDETGALSERAGGMSASLDADVLAQAQDSVAASDRDFGYLDELDLFYLVSDRNGVRTVAFADGSSGNQWKSTALGLAFGGLGALAAFFLLSILLSRWALRPVEEAWEKQKQFVADASHELKTPLTVVLANTSILLKHPEQSIAQNSQWLESMQVEAMRMQDLVGDMLTLAQTESDAVPLVKEPVDLSNLVSGLTLQYEAVAFERGLYLHDDIDGGIAVEGDRVKLGKLTATLIENACKYAGLGGSVDVSLKRIGSNALLSIHNTGDPISPEDLPHVFDRFYRADKARTQDEGSFGLGLAIAKSIADAHGGHIAVESSYARGTTFTVTLPLR